MSESSYRVSSTFFVTISFLLQIASIVSPGWVIDVQQNNEEYNNLFYKLSCTGTIDMECKLSSYYTVYKNKKEFLDWQRASQKVYIQNDKQMNEDVLEMTLVLVALLCTFIVFIAQMVRTCKPYKDYKRLIAISPTITSLANGLMISVICQRAILNYYMSRVRDLDEISYHTYIGFPYSIATYGVALLANFLSAYLNVSQTAGSLKKPPRKKMSDDFDELVPPSNKVPVTKTTEVAEKPVSSSPVAKISDNSYDNPTFSVKL